MPKFCTDCFVVTLFLSLSLSLGIELYHGSYFKRNISYELSNLSTFSLNLSKSKVCLKNM